MVNNLLLLVPFFLSSSSGLDNLIRLAGSSVPCSGRVEIYHNGIWGTVCDDSWDLNDAEVACRQLDCGHASAAPQSAYFGKGTGQIWLDDVVCSGNETSLDMCGHKGFGTHNCEHTEDAGIICSNTSIRLAGSSMPCSGRVEIYHNGIWGTVCDDSWDLNDAEVACRQVGCGHALAARQSAYFGQGTGQIWLDDVVCSGNETSLDMCGNNEFGTHNCGHTQDAGIICSGGSVKLVGPSRCSGRVEIYNSGSWGTVCNDGWDINDARVVCRHQDCGTAVSVGQFEQGTGQIWLDEVTCTGTERHLSECSHSGFGVHNCVHSQDAGLICSDEIQPTITMDPLHNIICGQNVSISCSVPQLQVGGTFILQKSSGSFTQSKETSQSAIFYISQVSFDDEGSFQCQLKVKVWNEEYSTLPSNSISLKVTLPRPNITMEPTGAVIWGQVVAITCSISIQDLGGSFTLQKTSGSFKKTHPSSTNSSTFRFLEANNNHVGDYQCYYTKALKDKTITSPLSPTVTISLTDV